MTYIYRGEDPYVYHEQPILTIGEIFEIENNTVVRNISNNNKRTKVTPEILSEILIKSSEYDPAQDMDYNMEDDPNVLKYLNSDFFIQLNKEIIEKLIQYGILRIEKHSCREYHIGASNYSEHIIQPWAIWQDYNLNPWDADIIKRVLRTKTEPGRSTIEARKLDYQKIIHLCNERIRQLNDNNISLV